MSRDFFEQLPGSENCHHVLCDCVQIRREDGKWAGRSMGQVSVPTHQFGDPLQWCRMKDRQRRCNRCEADYGPSKYGYVLSNCDWGDESKNNYSLVDECYVCKDAKWFKKQFGKTCACNLEQGYGFDNPCNPQVNPKTGDI